MWETHGTPRVLHVLSGHGATLRCLALSSSGHLLASVEQDAASVRLWDAAKGLPLPHQLSKGHASPVCSVSLSGSGLLAATACEGDPRVRLFSSVTGRLWAELAGLHVAPVTCVSLSSVGDVLASCSVDGTACVVRSATAGSRRTRPAAPPSAPPPTAKEAPKGAPAANIQDPKPAVQVPKPKSEAALPPPPPDDRCPFLTPVEGRLKPVAVGSTASFVTSVCMSADSGPAWTVAWAARGNAVRLRRAHFVHAAEPDTLLTGHTGSIVSMSMSSGGELLATCSRDTTVRGREPLGWRGLSSSAQ